MLEGLLEKRLEGEGGGGDDEDSHTSKEFDDSYTYDAAKREAWFKQQKEDKAIAR